MGLDEDSSVPFYRLQHPLPDGLSKTAYNGVVVSQQAPGSLVMIPHDENGRPQGPKKPPPLVDVVKVVICCIGVAIVVQSSCTKTRKVIGIPKVNHFIGSILLSKQQYGSQGVLVGSVAMGASDSHNALPGWNNVHG